jgi:TusA-related sulfurtransferase
MKMKRIDARGLSCPEPVIMIRQAMASKEAAYEMVVDNVASRENVTRYAEHQGYKVEVKEADGEYTLKMTR